MNANRILIILDDVWAFLHLEELGIPLRSDHLGCKILLTSRLQDVCVAMEAGRIITVEVLSKSEAWILFKEIAGEMVNSPDLYPIAMDVMKECKGLPIALVTVAKALKGKQVRPLWEDALLQLKRSIPANIPGFLRNVYKPLKLSYNHLESDEAKSLFLLCSLFPEDFSIYVKDLAIYGRGLGMLAGVQNLNEAHNRVHTLVEILKDGFMLLEGHNNAHVKMHDVVRDVAISIASDAFLISHDIDDSSKWPSRQSYENVSCISVTLNAAIELPTGLICPKLDFFRCQSNDLELKMPENFFKGLKTLRVIEIRQMDIIELPPSLQSLTSLEVLILRSRRLENVSIIGELVSLKILRLYCSDIEVLPSEIGRLTSLRVLDLGMCRNLQRIAPGVLSGLVQLEELNMLRFCGWEVEEEGTERSNAALAELESLSNLTSLRIHLPDQNVISRNICLSSKPTAYYLTIGPDPMKLERSFQRHMDLFLPTLTPLGDWIDFMLEGTESLRLEGDGSQNALNPLIPKGFQKVQELHLTSCHSVEYLANTMEGDSSTTVVFPVLEELSLIHVSCLETICHGPLPVMSFGRLRKLTLVRMHSLKQLWAGASRSVYFPCLNSVFIRKCPKLQHLFSLSMARGLMQLEKLEVIECEAIEEVFRKENAEDGTASHNIEFPKLERLVLESLPCLTDFCKGFQNVMLPVLVFSQLKYLPKLERKARFTLEQGKDTRIEAKRSWPP